MSRTSTAHLAGSQIALPDDRARQLREEREEEARELAAYERGLQAGESWEVAIAAVN
jgi:hypothetical protein